MTIHSKLQGATALHPAAFVQTTDPATSDPGAFTGTANGPNKLWIDVTNLNDIRYKVRKSDNSGWDDRTPAGAGGGGGGLQFPDSAPSAPSSFDDEFTTATLNAKWTEAISPDASFTKDADMFGHWWGMQGTGAAANTRYAIRQALTGFGAGVAFQVTVKFSLGWKQTPSGTPKVLVNVGTASTFETGSFTDYYILPSSNVIAVQEYNGVLNLNSTVGIDNAGVTIFLHIQRATDNTTRYYISTDGITWLLQGSAARAFAFDFLFLVVDGTTASGNPMRGLVDWVRVNDSRFTQPI